MVRQLVFPRPPCNLFGFTVRPAVAVLLASVERGIPQDLEAAVAWYRRAAEAGYAMAQYNLASMLAEGEGCERDLAAAREWLRRSVAGGYEYAEGLVAHLDALDDKAT